MALTHLCMGSKEATDFLEKILEAKTVVNELTGLAQTPKIYKQLATVYSTLNDILAPLCPNCEVKAQKFITSPTQLYDPDMANYLGGSRSYWSGEWACPKCGSVVAYGEPWWRTSRRSE